MKKLSLIITLALAAALFALAGCSGENQGSGREAEAPAAGGSQAAGQAAPHADDGMWHGTVVETMDAASYTYVLLDRGGDRVWVAGPQTTVAVGDAVVMQPGMAMPDFESKALGRTFDVVYFVGGIEQDDGHGHGHDHDQAAAPQGQAGGMPMGMGGANDASSHMAAGREQVEGVEKAAGGRTVAEILLNAADLKDQTVKVRGRVVKYSPNIMGVNWLHIQDGSGAEGTHDLTVTTDAKVKVGDVVLVEGPLSTDRDFGAGYRYAAIVENATVTVE